MKVGIIGAGFTGLAAAYKLSKKSVDVTVFEKEKIPGGLAIGFKKSNWKWSLEKHYHHWFTSDWYIRNLAKQIGHEVIFVRPKTSVFIKNEIRQLDSPIELLKFPYLSVVDKIRAGLTLGYLKATPYWQALEPFYARNFLIGTMGETAWKLLWEPLFVGKFGNYADKIPASWFWARIKKRSPSLGYPVGGFQDFASSIEKACRENGVQFRYSTSIESIRRINSKIVIVTKSKEHLFDKVICTLPFFSFTKMVQGLPRNYINKLQKFDSIGAVNLVLVLKNKFLTDGTYWLNINEKKFPFLAVVEHTNFMNKKYYGGKHILYIGNYLEHSHSYFEADEASLTKTFIPYLKKINPKFTNSWIESTHLFKAPFAQPIVPLNYSKIKPDHQTPIKDLYIANIQQVYPWDRGTNYAVELGQKVSNLLLNSNSI